MPFADRERFDLAERRRVRQVEIVAAVDAPGRDDANRRLVRLHVADLHRRGVRAQQRPRVVGRSNHQCTERCEIERVLHVARGMLRRHVQARRSSATRLRPPDPRRRRTPCA